MNVLALGAKLSILTVSLLPQEAALTRSSDPGPFAIRPAHRVPTQLARRFAQVCTSLAHEALFPVFGLEIVHGGVLVALRDTPGIDQRRLAATLGRDRTSTMQLVDDLEARGLVERRDVPGDRRSYALWLTVDGAELLDQRLGPALKAVQARILAALSPAEGEVLLSLLTRVVEANEAHARPGAARRRPPPRRSRPPERTGGAPCPDPPEPSPPPPVGPPSA